MPKRMTYDPVLFYTACLLVLVGLFMVGSASIFEALRRGLAPHSLLARHFIYALIGTVGFFLALKFPYRRLADRRLVFGLLLLSLIGLTAVFFMPEAKGAHRWLRLGGLSLQPSEFVKLVAILFVASLLARRESAIGRFWSVTAPCVLVVGLLTVMIALEPDLGTAVMIGLTCATMLFVAGLPWRYVAGVGGLGLAGFAVAVIAQPYRIQRIATFLRPDADVHGAGWQLKQSLIALGAGGWLGAGPGSGQQKAGFLPEPHTDFIFSVIGEELGLLGTTLILGAFLVLFWRGLRTVNRAPDRFGFYLALGISCLLTFQALVHFGVCLGLLPTKGLPLPFISYGGSSLVASMTGMGLLLNVSQYSN